MEDADALVSDSSQIDVASDRVRNLSQGAAILSLARLGIDTLPEDLLESRSNTEVVHLIVLDLKQNILQLLPSELFMCLSSLQELDVSENRLSYVPETIGLVSGLRTLKLQNNQIRNLPGGVCRLHNLEELSLGHNFLEHLPAAIGGLNSLRRLDLADNRLEEIPQEAGTLLMLDYVDVSGNPVHRMPLLIQRLQTKGELLRSKGQRRKLVKRALHVRDAVRAAFTEEAFREEI